MKSKPAINTKIRDACKKAGAVGGRVSSDRLTAEQRRQRSIKTGNTTLERFGLDYYAALGRASVKKRRENKLKREADAA